MSGEIVSLPSGTTAKALNKESMRLVEPAEQSDYQRAIQTQEWARKLFQKDFLGPEEVEMALNIDIDHRSVPRIYFSEAELVQAHKLGHRLVLRMRETADGEPITMQWLERHMQPIFDPMQIRNVLFSGYRGDPRWYENEDFFTLETPRAQWSLVSKDLLLKSLGKNYIEQLQSLKSYVESVVFEHSMPNNYLLADIEFENKRNKIEDLIRSQFNVTQLIKASRALQELQLTQLLMPTPVEVMFDQLVYYRHTDGIRLLSQGFAQTFSRTLGGQLVCFGSFHEEGMTADSSWPNDTLKTVGALLSRSW